MADTGQKIQALEPLDAVGAQLADHRLVQGDGIGGRDMGIGQPVPQDQLAARLGKGRKVGVCRIKQPMARAQRVQRRGGELQVLELEIRVFGGKGQIAQHRKGSHWRHDRTIGRIGDIDALPVQFRPVKRLAGGQKGAIPGILRAGIELARHLGLGRGQAGGGVGGTVSAGDAGRVELAQGRLGNQPVPDPVQPVAGRDHRLVQHGQPGRCQDDLARRIGIRPRLPAVIERVLDLKQHRRSPGNDAVEIVGETHGLHQRLAPAIRAAVEIAIGRVLTVKGADQRPGGPGGQMLRPPCEV